MLFRKIIIVLFLALSMTGCKAQQHLQQTRSQYDTPPFVLAIPDFQMVSEKEVPGDVRLVTYAVLEKMLKKPHSLQNVRFDPSGKHVLTEPDFDFQNFSLTSIMIQDYQVKELSGNDFFCRLEGYLTFTDHVNRQTVNYYQAEYRMTQAGIDVIKSVSLTVPPVFPYVQAFIINKNEMMRIVKSGLDFPELYSGVVSRARDMTPTQEEIRQRHELEEMSFFQRVRNTPLREREDNVMVIFVMDRLTPDAEIEVKVTSTLHDSRSIVSPDFFDFDGWQVAVFGGNFTIDRDVFYAKVYYRSARGILPDGNEEVLIGLFTSEKNYNVQQALQVQTSAQPAAQPAAQHVVQNDPEGPLASGTIFLDTAKRDDAAMIQSRLAELGFYNMAVDGLWGQGSRGALQGFQKAKNFTANGEWTLQSQMSLFNGTGK